MMIDNNLCKGLTFWSTHALSIAWILSFDLLTWHSDTTILIPVHPVLGSHVLSPQSWSPSENLFFFDSFFLLFLFMNSFMTENYTDGGGLGKPRHWCNSFKFEGLLELWHPVSYHGVDDGIDDVINNLEVFKRMEYCADVSSKRCSELFLWCKTEKNNNTSIRLLYHITFPRLQRIDG